MVRLISGTAAIIFATATLASAAPRQGVPSRPSTAARAKTVKPQEMIDSRYLDEMEKSGFFDQIWGRK